MEDNAGFEVVLQETLTLFKKNNQNIDLKKVEDAARAAYEILGDTSWETGGPIIFHSLAVAKNCCP